MTYCVLRESVFRAARGACCQVGWREGRENRSLSTTSGNSRGSSGHWLPPSLRKWLDDSARTAWTNALEKALENEKYVTRLHALHGRSKEIAETAAAHADEIIERHKTHVVDASTQHSESNSLPTSSAFMTHLKNIALAIGTYKSTVHYINSDDAIKMIMDINGGLASSLVFQPLAKMTMAFTLDPYARMSRSLRLLRHDYGDDSFTFEELVKHSNDHDKVGVEVERRLRITKCLYRDVIHAENSRNSVTSSISSNHILDACCCSIDKLWFEAMAEGAKSKVEFFYSNTWTDGHKDSSNNKNIVHDGIASNECCEFIVRRKQYKT